MNPRDILDLVDQLSALKFFPSAGGARIAIARLIGAIAANMDQVDWLIGVMTSGIYNEWPGPGEMRGRFCRYFRPLDGIEASCSVCPDGFPGERPQFIAPALPPPPSPPALPAGRVASVSDDLDELVQDIAQRKNLNAAVADVDDPRDIARHYRLRLRQLRKAPVPTPDEIEALKTAQRERAEHEETRRILERLEEAKIQ
jgi:hypothetical protein